MEPSEEAAHILSQVAALDKQYQRERATLLQKLKHIQLPIVSRIPSEVLSRIFWFATGPDDVPEHVSRLFSGPRAKLFRLRSVCSRWRRVTDSSPQLWTTLTLTCTTQATGFVGLVKHYCQRIGATAMSVYISDLYALPSTTIDLIVQVLLKDHPGKLRSLHLGYSSNTSIWPAIFKYAKEDVEFTLLEELDFYWERGSERKRKPQEVPIFKNSPHLRTLKLSGVPNIPIKFPWTQITNLHLRCLGLKYTLRLLTLCPNLIELESWFYDLNENLQAFRGGQVTSAPFLRTLTWMLISESRHFELQRPNGPTKPADSIAFTQFRFPAVRKLVWNAPVPSYAPHAQEFFANMREIQELKFSPSQRFYGLWKYEIDQHLGLFSNVTTLEADSRDFDEDSEWLHRLIIKQGGDNLFPHLQKLHIFTTTAFFDDLIVLLHSRRNGPVDLARTQGDSKKLILEPYDDTSTHWQSHARLLEFSVRYDDPEGPLEWPISDYYDAFEDIVQEAKEAEGVNFDLEEDGPDGYAKIVFYS